MAGVLAIVPAESKKNRDASLSVSRLTLLIKVIHAKVVYLASPALATVYSPNAIC